MGPLMQTKKSVSWKYGFRKVSIQKGQHNRCEGLAFQVWVIDKHSTPEKWTMAARNWAYFSVCYGRAVLYIFLLNGHFKKAQTLQTSLKEIRNMSRSLTCLLTERLILKTDIPFNLAMQWFQVQFIQTCNMMVCVVHGVARSLHVSSNECRHPMQWWSLFWLEVLYDQTSSRF